MKVVEARYSAEANAPNGRIDVGLKVADEPMRAEN
jgi:hypothetical protein